FGESGVGKEVFSRYIHTHSKRSNKPFVAINMAAIPANLIESELFGFEKGAFTDANATKIGLFEMANEGTLFLDEIGEMPYEIQAKLLRALQEKEITRLGSTKSIKIDVRIISATNANLDEKIKNGEFRSD
ncbi:fla regulon two-component system response regulator, partial [Campylobacter jejuni]|nr:fla regulon two-component system response regulator [Campylobacter jejuni]